MSRKCNTCGYDVEEKDIYCTNCGSLIKKVEGKPQSSLEPKASAKADKEAPLSLGDYMLIGLILMIPIANIVILFIWAFDKYANLNRRNLAKAMLIYTGIGMAIGVVFWIAVMQAVITDIDRMPIDEYTEYYMEHPDIQDWIDMPYSFDET